MWGLMLVYTMMDCFAHCPSSEATAGELEAMGLSDAAYPEVIGADAA